MPLRTLPALINLSHCSQELPGRRCTPPLPLPAGAWRSAVDKTPDAPKIRTHAKYLAKLDWTLIISAPQVRCEIFSYCQILWPNRKRIDHFTEWCEFWPYQTRDKGKKRLQSGKCLKSSKIPLLKCKTLITSTPQVQCEFSFKWQKMGIIRKRNDWELRAGAF